MDGRTIRKLHWLHQGYQWRSRGISSQRRKSGPTVSNLQGDIVATAHDSETSTPLNPRSPKLASTASQQPKAHPNTHGSEHKRSDARYHPAHVAMGARSYVPSSAIPADRPLQAVQPTPTPTLTATPVNETDLTGDYVENDYVLSTWVGTKRGER